MRTTSILLLSLYSLISACTGSTPQKPMQQVIDEAFKTSIEQYTLMAEKLATNDSLLPRTFDGKQLITSDPHWWCSGFFPGSLWYLYEYSHNDSLLAYARQYTARVECEKYTTDNHDIGFILFCSFGNGLRLTGDPAYREVLHTGSKSLATRYNPTVGLIRSWDFNKEVWEYPVIIDNMMNLEMLLWTAKAFKEPVYRDISISHANKTMKYHYRNDYSSYHVVSYDTITGLPHARHTHQGYAHESAGSRGQAWGLYGYTFMYRETGDKTYLEQAKHIAHYLIHHPHMPKDYIPYWDMDAPDIPNALRDASAAAIMASGLIELSNYVEPELTEEYMSVVEKQLRMLSSPEYTAPVGENGNFILKHSVGYLNENSEVDAPLTYADYYYLEALMRYKKQVLDKEDAPEELVFQSGFEPDSRVIPFKRDKGNLTPGFDCDDIIGTDNTFTEKNDFVKDLDEAPNGGRFLLEYTGGDESKRFARIIPEPGNPNNHVLYFWLGDSWLASENQVKARIQADIYSIPKPYKEFYQRVRVFLHKDFNALRKYPQSIPWLTIAEFWNNEWWVAGEQNGFRITVGIGKPTAAESDLYFILEAEDAGQKKVWEADKASAKVPIGQWFTLEYYFREGNKVTGRFTMVITPDGGERQVLFDVNDYTHNSYDLAPNGLSGYNPMKLYTSREVVGFMKNQGKALQIYWDDFELWINKKMK